MAQHQPVSVFVEIGNSKDDTVTLNPETLITLFVKEFCQNENTQLCLIQSTKSDCPCRVSSSSLKSYKKYFSIQDAPFEVQQCCLPCATVSGGGAKVIHSGLGAVLRLLVKVAICENPDTTVSEILGPRGSALQGCAESSNWTKLCEVDMPIEVQNVINHGPFRHEDQIVIPETFMRLENHLSAPVVAANIKKKEKDALDKYMAQMKIDDKDKTDKEKSVLDVGCLPRYVDGYILTLPDLALLPSIHTILEAWNVNITQLEVHLPCLCKWYKLVSSNVEVMKAAKQIDLNLDVTNCTEFKKNSNTRITVPLHIKDGINVSIRDSSKKKFKVSLENITASIQKLQDFAIEVAEIESPFKDMSLKWEELPRPLHPCDGDLPLSRATRKCQQLENLLAGVKLVAKPGDTVVDFCSGGGHVGILLAYNFPECHIVLVENKEESMRRACERVERLGLTNITLYKCNMDYYQGSFNVGVCLHACGVATDLVLQTCLQNDANFVVCPCCYGSIRNTHTVSYPRSATYGNTQLSYEEYLTLGHAADQTQSNSPYAVQGKKCMLLIDTDRAKQAEECGYHVTLTSLNPLTCSPKNDLLIGWK